MALMPRLFALTLLLGGTFSAHIFAPWMCLERCGDSADDIDAQFAQLSANLSVFTAVQYEAYNLGPASALVANNLSDVGPRIGALGLERWAMVSSYPYPPEFLSYMRAVFAAPAPFIAACLAEGKGKNLSGFNIDWEPPSGKGAPVPTPQDAADYAAFLSALARALHAGGMKVSVAAATWSPIWNLTALGASEVDFVATMGTYTAKFETWDEQLAEALAAIPLPKLIVGLETGNVNATGLAQRLTALQAADVRQLGLWRLPVPAEYWPFLRAWIGPGGGA